jgi:ABC-type oligopeptide transport system ATPase subunit
VAAVEPLYDIRNASRFFTKGSIVVRALADVDLRIGQGEFVARIFYGDSGVKKIVRRREHNFLFAFSL